MARETVIYKKPTAAAMGLWPAWSRIIYDYTHDGRMQPVVMAPKSLHKTLKYRKEKHRKGRNRTPEKNTKRLERPENKIECTVYEEGIEYVKITMRSIATTPRAP